MQNSQQIGIYQQIGILELKAQYRILSELESKFPKKSKHKVYVFIDQKMTEILKQINTLSTT